MGIFSGIGEWFSGVPRRMGRYRYLLVDHGSENVEPDVTNALANIGIWFTGMFQKHGLVNKHL